MPVDRAILRTLVVGIGFVVFSVLAVNPADLRHNLSEWLDPVGGFESVWPPVIAAALTWIVCIAYFRVARRGAASTLCNYAEFSGQFRQAVADADRIIVKVFGYTGETVLNDILSYSDRYEARISVRMLNRNWVVEAADEARFNALPSSDGFRPWAKSEAIRAVAIAPWPHSMRREIRYFSSPPVIKGIIVCDGEGTPSLAWISFFHWQDRPQGGGSPFKGLPHAFVSLRAGRGLDDHLLTYVNSQFDLLWLTSSSADAVRAGEG